MSDISKDINSRIGYYLAGFADGEGCFYVSFRPRSDYKIGWKISLCFNVSQKETLILAMFKKNLGCGKLRSRKDGMWYYEVNNFNSIVENVIPFFRKFSFLSLKKKNDFANFQQIAELVKNGKHLTPLGLEEILNIRKRFNRNNYRYSDSFILNKIKESSETIRQTE